MQARALIAVLLLASGQTLPGSEAQTGPQLELRSHAEWPAANAADVSTPETIVHAFFEDISTSAGGSLSRPALESLFLPNGKIAILQPGQKSGSEDVLLLTPAQYADSSDAQTRSTGFLDHTIAMNTQTFGDVSQVAASYESRHFKGEAQPFVRGVKFFQLVRCEGRWYIASVSWDREASGRTIPRSLLHNDNVR